jgi:hypothetical protein
MLQSKAGYIDARSFTASSTKSTCNARPDHTSGSSSTKLGCSRHVRVTLDSDRTADIPHRQLRAKACLQVHHKFKPAGQVNPYCGTPGTA